MARHDENEQDEVRVRPAGDADASAIQTIYADTVESTAISFEVTPPDEHEIRRRMAATPRLPWLVATKRRQVVGYAYAAAHRQRAGYRWSAETSVYVGQGHRAQGVGRKLYEDLIAHMRELHYVSLLAVITLPNQSSVALHEALGFQTVGVFPHLGFKQGSWHDVAWLQLALSDPPTPPTEPREWTSASLTSMSLQVPTPVSDL